MNSQEVTGANLGYKHRAKMVARVITTRTGRLWLDGRGIVHVEALPGSDQTRADAVETVAQIGELAGGRQALVVVDLRRNKSIDRAARSYYASATAARAVAAIIGSPLTGIILNVFIGFNKPSYPVRVFTNEPDALAWLRSLPEPVCEAPRDG